MICFSRHSTISLLRGPILAAAVSFCTTGSFVTPIKAQNPPVQPPVEPGEGPVIKRSTIIPKAQPVQPSTPTDPDSATWERNPHTAFAKAKSQQKPLLLLFTAQWNAICQNLSSEVFSSKTFNQYANKNLVICFLDYPRNPTDAHESLRQLKEKFKVNGFPVLLVFDPDGHVIHQATGYRSGRPVDYFNALKSITDTEITNLKEKRKRLISQGYREWTNASGKVFFARFIRRDAGSLTLQDSSGKKWEIRLEDLSADDRLFARSFPERIK